MRGYSQMSTLLESLNMLNMTQNLLRKNEWQFPTGDKKRNTDKNEKGKGQKSRGWW
jgi:hypothetical protein